MDRLLLFRGQLGRGTATLLRFGDRGLLWRATDLAHSPLGQFKNLRNGLLGKMALFIEPSDTPIPIGRIHYRHLATILNQLCGNSINV